MVKKAGGKAAVKADGTMLPMRVAHRIESLLHTMRVIERHEEQLCVLMTEIKTTGVLSGGVREELHALLEELPADAYRLDMEAVSMALLTSEEGTKSGKGKAMSRTAAKKARKATARR